MLGKQLMSKSRIILVLRGIRWLMARELSKGNRESGMELLHEIGAEIEEAENEMSAAAAISGARASETAPVQQGQLKEKADGEDSGS